MPRNNAADYRRLARGAEKIETRATKQTTQSVSSFGYTEAQPCFTCNAVDNALGYDARRAYTEAFDLLNNENELWRLPDCPSIRVLMLCFAAAMAETGDL